jgi:nicotinamide-nucleotide amidase
LAELGLELSLKTCVGDEVSTLKACIASALHRSGLIIATGGLGPTFDDQTKEAFAEIIGAPMIEDSQVRSDIDSFFQARGRKATENNYKQALIPQGAMAIRNPLGTAPGVYWEGPPNFPSRTIVMLPGVPKEMMAMWGSDVHPRLSNLSKSPLKTARLVVGGVGESVLDERTGPIRQRHPRLNWTILAPRTHVEFLIRGENSQELDAAIKDMEAGLGADLVCVGDGMPETVLLDMLIARGDTLALAESVTGGILSSRLSSVPGASRAYIGGTVAYTPKAKVALASLDKNFIESHGTVCEATTREMAICIRERLDATWGLATTGNAGPTVDKNATNDGNDQIGRCFIAVAGPDGVDCQAINVHGDRGDIQFRAANWAIDMLRRRMLCLSPS